MKKSLFNLLLGLSCGTCGGIFALEPGPTEIIALQPADSDIQYLLEEEDITNEASKEASKRWLSGSIVGTYWDGYVREGTPFQLNQVWLTSERTADTAEKPFNWGYSLDAIFGTTLAQSSGDGGFDGRWGVSGDGMGASLAQASATGAAGPFSLTFGKFFTPLGYESFDASKRDFASTSYMYYHESGTHCGGMVQYQMNDRLSFGFGLANGADCSLEDRFGDCGYLFTAGWTVSDRLEISYAGEIDKVQSRLGENRALVSYDYYDTLNGLSVAGPDEYLQTIVVKSTVSDRLSYSFVTNYGTMTDREESLQRYGEFAFAHYFTYKITDRLSSAFRYEYFSQWLTEAGKNPASETSGEEHYHAITANITVKPAEAAYIRPEVRYDWKHYGNNTSGFTGAVSCGVLF